MTSMNGRIPPGAGNPLVWVNEKLYSKNLPGVSLRIYPTVYIYKNGVCTEQTLRNEPGCLAVFDSKDLTDEEYEEMKAGFRNLVDVYNRTCGDEHAFFYEKLV